MKGMSGCNRSALYQTGNGYDAGCGKAGSRLSWADRSVFGSWVRARSDICHLLHDSGFVPARSNYRLFLLRVDAGFKVVGPASSAPSLRPRLFGQSSFREWSQLDGKMYAHDIIQGDAMMGLMVPKHRPIVDQAWGTRVSVTLRRWHLEVAQLWDTKQWKFRYIAKFPRPGHIHRRIAGGVLRSGELVSSTIAEK